LTSAPEIRSSTCCGECDARTIANRIACACDSNSWGSAHLNKLACASIAEIHFSCYCIVGSGTWTDRNTWAGASIVPSVIECAARSERYRFTVADVIVAYCNYGNDLINYINGDAA